MLKVEVIGNLGADAEVKDYQGKQVRNVSCSAFKQVQEC